MARGNTLSLLGLYNYDDTIFNNLVVPNELDKDILIKNILLESAELEVIYPQPSILKEAIGYWSSSRLQAWNKMAIVLYEDYEPFINIKRDEVRTIEQERNLKNTIEGGSEYKVNAYDSTEAQQRDETKNNNVGTDTGTIITKETFHVEGDSAITDAQDVLEKEFKVRAQYDLYKYIKDEFINRFCLMVY